jgi:signal peptidase I
MNENPNTNQQNDGGEKVAVTENKPAEKKNDGYLFDIFEMIGIALIVVLFLFTFVFRTARVDGPSMNKTLTHGELLVTSNLFYEPEAGDIVVFHLCNDAYNHPIVKRVIAMEGQQVKIDLTAREVYVDGQLLDEPYAYLDTGDYSPAGYFDYNRLYIDPNGHTVFMTTVPEGTLFVMGDNRNHSSDSRSVGIGFVDEDCILGRVVLRFKPFTIFH